MEIEMKALCREDQIPNLFKNKLGNFTKINTESDDLLFKSDKYYSWACNDPIHPRKAGYLQWWTPYIQAYLENELA